MHRMSVSRAAFAAVGSAVALVLAVPVLAVALPLWLVAAMTRALARFYQPSMVKWPDLFEFHPRLGWKTIPHFRGHCLEERADVFRVHTGSDGWPGTRNLADSDVVVFGDSYAFGYGVNVNQAFFAVDPTLRIKAIGAPGYNMVQELLVMQEMASALRGKTVVWFIYFGNDLYDNLAPEMNGYRMPFVAQTARGDWRIVTEHVQAERWSCSVGKPRNHYVDRLFSPGFMAERAFSACEFLIERGQATCRAVSAELVVVTIPHPTLLRGATCRAPKIDGGYPDRRMQAICEKFHVPIVALRDVLDPTDYNPDDEHWNEQGHRKVAKLLGRLTQPSRAVMSA